MTGLDHPPVEFRSNKGLILRSQVILKLHHLHVFPDRVCEELKAAQVCLGEFLEHRPTGGNHPDQGRLSAMAPLESLLPVDTPVDLE